MTGKKNRRNQRVDSAIDFDIDMQASSSRFNLNETYEPNVKFNFSDFENILRRFSGDETISVVLWLREFEQYAETFNWNDMQKFIFCKRLLSGAAKAFVECEAKPLNFHSLKTALLKEFQSRTNSAEIHKILRERKKRDNESIREYLYHMMDIGSQAYVDDSSIIGYVIDGIRDSVNNKIILYGAKSIEELKEKLIIYEKVIKDSKGMVKVNDCNYQRNYTEKSKNKIRSAKKYCYNCGSPEHEFYSCPQKGKGPKCFKCDKFGHKRINCPNLLGTLNYEGSGRESSMKTAHVIVKSGMYVTAKVNGIKIEALIDTGSDICILKESLLKLINPQYFCRDSHVLVSGLGADVTTQGCCKVDIEINKEVFEGVDVHLVKSHFMRPDLIVGMDLLSKAIVSIEGGRANIKGKVTTVENEKIESMDLKRKESDSSGCFLADIVVDTYYTELDNLPCLPNLQNKEIAKKLLTLIQNYSPESPAESPIQMKLVTIDDEPVYRPPRRFPPIERKFIDEQVKDWLKTGIVRESVSDYASQVVLVRKKDGSHRLCVDYRGINKKLHKDHYPIPNMDDQIDKLQGAKYFTTLDLENGFFHVSVEENSRKYTAFVTQSGQFEFMRVPFGLCNSPSVFQKYINYVLKDLINENIVVVYIDDIVIPSQTPEEGLERLKRVLDVAQRNGLRIKWKKCQFLQEVIEYLGHTIREGIVAPSSSKIKAVLNFPTPSTAKQIQSFLGLAGYFRKFIHNFAIKARPLSDLLKKEAKFKLEEIHVAAINELKHALSTKPVLRIFHYGAHTELHTDASKEGYGAILLQKGSDDNALHPVCYMSRKTSKVEKNYSSYELEVLAIIEAIKKFRIYLLGCKFKLVTDCKAFECTMRKKDLTTRVARWALLLQEFDYELEHRSGNRMKHVDALSRNPAVMCISANSGFLRKLEEVQKRDERLNAIIELLKQGPYKDYTLQNNILCKTINNNVLFVVPEQMIGNILKEVHEKGHFRTKKMKEVIEKEFYISNLEKRIDKYIAGCVKCILGDRKLGKAEGFLHPIPKGDRPLETFHIDHLGPMQTTRKNYKYIFAVIDGFTKFCWLFPTKSLSTEEVIQKIEIIADTFGYPGRIIADKGGAFVSNQFQDYCKSHDVKLYFVTAGVPRGNGQIERLHSTVISGLTKLCLDDSEKWYSYVKSFQRILNSTVQRTINTTPFQLLVGTKMKTDNELRIIEIIEEESRQQFNEAREEQRERAKLEINKMQEENRRNYNKRRKKATKYAVGDLIAIERTQFGVGLKIKPKFLGPYQIIAIKGHDRYKVGKVGNTEGPKITETSADKMKLWIENSEEDISNDDMEDGELINSVDEEKHIEVTGSLSEADN